MKLKIILKKLLSLGFEYKELFSLFPMMFENAMYLHPDLILEYGDLIKKIENERISIILIFFLIFMNFLNRLMRKMYIYK